MDYFAASSSWPPTGHHARVSRDAFALTQTLTLPESSFQVSKFIGRTLTFVLSATLNLQCLAETYMITSKSDIVTCLKCSGIFEMGKHLFVFLRTKTQPYVFGSAGAIPGVKIAKKLLSSLASRVAGHRVIFLAQFLWEP